jgi:hypothetical protein
MTTTCLGFECTCTRARRQHIRFTGSSTRQLPSLGKPDAHAPFEAFISQPLDQLLHKLHLHFALHLSSKRRGNGSI